MLKERKKIVTELAIGLCWLLFTRVLLNKYLYITGFLYGLCLPIAMIFLGKQHGEMDLVSVLPGVVLASSILFVFRQVVQSFYSDFKGGSIVLFSMTKITKNTYIFSYYIEGCLLVLVSLLAFYIAALFNEISYESHVLMLGVSFIHAIFLTGIAFIGVYIFGVRPLAYARSVLALGLIVFTPLYYLQTFDGWSNLVYIIPTFSAIHILRDSVINPMHWLGLILPTLIIVVCSVWFFKWEMFLNNED